MSDDPLESFFADETPTATDAKARRLARQAEKEAEASAPVPAEEAPSSVTSEAEAAKARRAARAAEKEAVKPEEPKEEQKVIENPTEEPKSVPDEDEPSITKKTPKEPKEPAAPPKPIERGEMAQWDKTFECCYNDGKTEFYLDGKLVRTTTSPSNIEDWHPLTKKPKEKKKGKSDE